MYDQTDPIFTITDPNGHIYKIWEHGLIEGFPDNDKCIVNNDIGQLVSAYESIKLSLQEAREQNDHHNILSFRDSLISGVRILLRLTGIVRIHQIVLTFLGIARYKILLHLGPKKKTKLHLTVAETYLPFEKNLFYTFWL